MANIISTFIDALSIVSRKAESGTPIPAASWEGGCNDTGANAPAIGVGTATKIAESGQWTLNDQAGAPRTPQKSQSIGGIAQASSIVTNAADGSGDITIAGAATLTTLDAGWVAV